MPVEKRKLEELLILSYNIFNKNLVNINDIYYILGQFEKNILDFNFMILSHENLSEYSKHKEGFFECIKYILETDISKLSQAKIFKNINKIIDIPLIQTKILKIENIIDDNDKTFEKN